MQADLRAPVTSPAISGEELALWEARGESGAGSARDQLFALYLPVARRLARRFMRDDPRVPVEFAEVQQLASVGLIEAIDSFKPELGVPFRYYCTRRIRGAILEGISRLTEVSQQISTRRRIERERLRSLKGRGADTARAICSIELRIASGEGIFASGYYKDKLRREGGTWKFVERSVTFFRWGPA